MSDSSSSFYEMHDAYSNRKRTKLKRIIRSLFQIRPPCLLNLKTNQSTHLIHFEHDLVILISYFSLFLKLLHYYASTYNWLGFGKDLRYIPTLYMWIENRERKINNKNNNKKSPNQKDKITEKSACMGRCEESVRCI